MFSSFSVPLQPLFLIIGRNWLVGLSGPLISIYVFFVFLPRAPRTAQGSRPFHLETIRIGIPGILIEIHIDLQVQLCSLDHFGTLCSHKSAHVTHMFSCLLLTTDPYAYPPRVWNPDGRMTEMLWNHRPYHRPPDLRKVEILMRVPALRCLTMPRDASRALCLVVPGFA